MTNLAHAMVQANRLNLATAEPKSCPCAREPAHARLPVVWKAWKEGVRDVSGVVVFHVMVDRCLHVRKLAFPSHARRAACMSPECLREGVDAIGLGF